MTYDCESGVHEEPVHAVDECTGCSRMLCRSCTTQGCCGRRPARGIRGAEDEQEPLFQPRLGVDVCATPGCGRVLSRGERGPISTAGMCHPCRSAYSARKHAAPTRVDRNPLPGIDDVADVNRRIRRYVELGYTAPEIAAEVGLTAEAASQRIRRMGLSTGAATRVLG